MEQSYIDLITKLAEDIKTDCIPTADRLKIEGHINALKELLWKYSA